MTKMDVLNNREWATIIWLLLVISYLAFSPKMKNVRSSFGEFVRVTFAKVLVRFYCISLCYVTAVLYFLHSIGFWHSHQLKNTIVWFFTVGLYSSFQVEKIKQDRNYLKRLVLDSFKFIAVLEFVINIQPLNFFVELVIIPILFVIVIISEISKRDSKLEVISKITNFIMIIFGLVILISALYSIAISIGKIDFEKVGYDFATPTILTLLYLPFLFVLMLQSTFNSAFRKVDHNIEKPSHRFVAKTLALLLLNVRTELVDRWGIHLNIFRPNSFKDIRLSFRTIFKMKSAENNPPKISSKDGWSPYMAKEFLSDNEITTGYYHPSFDEWAAYSNLVEFGTDIIPNNIAYYVEGTKDVANILKLKLNVNNSKSSKEALSYFISIASILYHKAIGEIFPESLRKSILSCQEIVIEENDNQVVVARDIWKNHAYNGFGIKFVISKE